jgi:hypothetical protein
MNSMFCLCICICICICIIKTGIIDSMDADFVSLSVILAMLSVIASNESRALQCLSFESH